MAFPGTVWMWSVRWSWQLADGFPRGFGALSRAGSADVLHFVTSIGFTRFRCSIEVVVSEGFCVYFVGHHMWMSGSTFSLSKPASKTV